MTIERILGTDTGKQAFDKCNTNFDTNKTDILTLQTQNGSEVLTTDAQTLSGAINEHEAQINSLNTNKANKIQGAWITPTLLNGWVNYSPALREVAGYMVDEFGFLRFKGLIKSGSLGSLFTLPIGYRPALNVFVTVLTSSGSSRVATELEIDVETGNVYMWAGGTVWVNLNNVVCQIV